MTSIEITAKMVGELRVRTGVGLMECKKALKASSGDFEAAITYLKKKGMVSASKKAGRDASEGIIEAYVHLGSKVGVLLEVNCETDFVAKNESFKEFARGVCMHIAAAHPLYVSDESISNDAIEKEREIARAQCAGKPENVIEKIVDGKIDKWKAQVCLLDQAYVKNPDQTIRELLTEKIAQMGENIVLQRFTRFQIG